MAKKITSIFVDEIQKNKALKKAKKNNINSFSQLVQIFIENYLKSKNGLW